MSAAIRLPWLASTARAPSSGPAAGKIDGDKIVMDLSKPAPNNKEGAKPDGKEGVELTRTKLGASFEGAEYSKVFYGPFVNRLLEVGYGY